MATLGQAYVDGDLDVDGRVEDIFNVVVELSAKGGGGPERRHARFGRHTRKVDAEAIAYHYDVSNDFYRISAREMVYSCAYFHSEDDTLEQAQRQKIDGILAKIGAQPGQTLLDIGCGWGALVLRAAPKFGA